jgi:hypothetical protein
MYAGVGTDQKFDTYWAGMKELFDSHNKSGYERTDRSLHSRCGVDEGMSNGPSIFAYLVFGPGGTSVEGIARPMKLIVWRGLGARLGVQCKT